MLERGLQSTGSPRSGNHGMDMNLAQLLAQAGWTMVPLYVCSIGGLAVLIRKAVQFRRLKVGDDSLLAGISEGELDEVAERMKAADTPLGRVLATAAEATRLRPKRAEDETARTANLELDGLERGLALLAFIAQAAPLFGLLGTVLGMVDLFSGMEAAGDAASSATLSSGIWKALLTTAAGLMVAIPTLGGHVWLTRRVDHQRLLMETGAGRILDRAAG